MVAPHVFYFKDSCYLQLEIGKYRWMFHGILVFVSFVYSVEHFAIL